MGRMHTCSNPLEKGEPVSRLAPTHTQITRPRAEALRREGERKNSVLAEMTQCVRSQGKQGAVGGSMPPTNSFATVNTARERRREWEEEKQTV